MAQGAAHIVQLVITVNGTDYRQSRGAPQQGAHHVGAGAVAVDDLVATLLDIGGQLPTEPGNVVAAHDLRGDAHAAGLLCKGTVPEADHLGGDGLVQILQQTQYVGLGAAGVAAAD